MKNEKNDHKNILLEKIENNPTKLFEIESEASYLGDCACPGCGCITDDFIIILSPVGVAGSGIAYVAASPF